MSRSILFSCIISALILGAFTLISQEYRRTASYTALESPLLAASTVPTVTVDAPIHKANTPTILFHQPEQEALREMQPTIYLAFDQAMDQATVQAALTVTPTAALEVSWLENTLYLRPAVPLLPGVTYRFTLTTTARSQQGAPLAAPYTWRYRSPHTLYTTGGLMPRGLPFQFGFSGAIDKNSFAQALAIAPDTLFTVTWNAEATQVTITPARPLLAGADYTISFHQPLQDAEGYPIQPPAPLHFTTQPAVLGYEPATYNMPSLWAPIKVTFDPPIDQDATAASLQVTPPTTGTVAWEGNTLLFTPATGMLRPVTNYAVSVTLYSRAGDTVAPVAPPHAWTFTTGNLPIWADFGSGLKIQALATDGARTIQYHRQAHPEVAESGPPLTFALYHAPATALAAFLQPDAKLSQTTWITTEQSQLVARWPITAPLLTAANASDPGQNFLTTQVPTNVVPGLYVLALETGYTNDQLLILLSNYKIAVKQAATGAAPQLTVWVTGAGNQAAANLPVRVIDESGAVLATGETNAEGIWQPALATDAKPWLVIAEQGAELAVSGLSGEWRSRNLLTALWEPPTEPAAPYRTYLYTDRPLYRPGQTVYFKGIVQQDDDALLTMPSVDTPVTVRVRDARNNLVRSYALHTNTQGTVHGDFVLAAGAMLGDYTVEAEVTGALNHQSFQVEEYRKPDYSVTVTATAQTFPNHTVITVTVQSRYLTGRPVANAAVELTSYLLSPGFYADGASRPVWGNPLPLRSGVTGANGWFTDTLSFEPGMLPYYGYGQSYSWALEATVNDGSNQSVSAATQIDLAPLGQPLAGTLTITRDALSKTPGELFYLTVGAIDPVGAPAPYQPMRLTINGQPAPGNAFAPGVQMMNLVTNGSGRLRVPFLAEAPGFYRLTLDRYDTKGLGSGAVTASYLLAYDPAQPWVAQPDGFLAIESDQPRYAPGDTARLQILSSYGGLAWLTLERGSVRRSRLIQLTPPITPVELPIQAEDAPNLFVTVNVWTANNAPADFTSNPGRYLRSATAALAVTPVNKRLTVTITPDQTTYAPRIAAQFQVQVTDETGKPVAAELSLALVDEAIYQLSADLTKPIYDFFYAPRPNQVESYNSFAPTRVSGGWGGGGGGGFQPANPRWRFPDTALWLPVIATDANGVATIDLTLPDTVTRWRAVVKAVTTASQVGEATVSLTTTQTVSIRPLLPPGLTVGDRALLSALVHNDTPVSRTLTITLALSATQPVTALTILAPPTQVITIAPQATQLVGWPVQAVQPATVTLLVAAVTAEGKDGILSDAVREPLLIRPHAIHNVAVQIGQFTGQFTTALTLPVTLTELSKVQIELNRTLAGSMLEGLGYLTGYPYGCVEQTMSRALPNAVVGRVFAQLGVGDPALAEQLPGLINAGLQQLYAFQHDDGGWGWWFDDSSDPYQTAWVLFGLAVTAEAGYEVDPGVIERGNGYLADKLLTLDAKTQAFALYSLSLTKPGTYTNVMQALSERTTDLDAFSLAALALALHQDGATTEANALVDQLVSTAIVEGDLIHWGTGDSDGAYQQKTMASAVRSTALALRALIQIRPGDEREAGIVEWLMGKRQQQGWGTTNETTFTLLALTDHLRNSTLAGAEADYTVWLNEAAVGQGQLAAATPLGVLTLTQQLQPGSNTVRIAGPADRRLYYRITTHSYAMEAARQQAGTVTVYREYINVQSRQPITTAKAGQLVEVQLIVHLPQPTSYLLIEDRLPGGLTALNERLNSQRVGIPTGAVQPTWQDLGYNYKEVRPERVSFFVTEVAGGERMISYLARAMVAGEFVALPTEAYAMYDEHTWGRSASNRFVVVE